MSSLHNSRPLDVLAMPLKGRHLIEASAGTGKTFNITRLFLRLLLEKNLTVQQILIMTFTKAATEEIKGRIAASLREALFIWKTAMQDESALLQFDEVFQALYQLAPGERGVTALQAALLELDEASVFTIHGFCNKVITEMAFDSGTPMSVNLETDTRHFWEQAAQDWIRKVAVDPEHYTMLMEKGWHIPEVFLSTFWQGLQSGLDPVYQNSQAINDELENEMVAFEQSAQQQMADRYKDLHNAYPDIASWLIEPKPPKEREKRGAEWHALLDWLASAEVIEPAKQALSFCHSARYSRHPEKEQLKKLLKPVDELAKFIKNTPTLLAKVRDKKLAEISRYQLICQGFSFIRQHVAQAKRKLGVVDFDDLIRLLAAQVISGNQALTQTLRQRFPVALIDEFQDTDAHQYSILSGIYSADTDDTALMMIGDPKQAIYGFRGGDIFTYLEAGREADYRWVMDTNWRSVASMVDAYNRLFFGTPIDEGGRDVFGFDIQYEPVKSTPHAKAAKQHFEDRQERGALNYVVQPLEEGASVAFDQVARPLANWLSHEVLRLLSDATLNEQPLMPADIAILVRTGNEASAVKEALAKVGLSAVYLSGSTPLFASSEAADLYRVLDGIWHSEQVQRLSAALTSPLLGYSHAEMVAMLHSEDDALWEACMFRVNELRTIWATQGCMALVLELVREYYTPVDLATERHLTNYLHLAEALEKTATVTPQPEQLLLWLHRQIHEPQGADEMTQRLESDAQLIQIVTQHGSKGLEYPVVFVPFATSYRNPVKQGKQDAPFYRYYDGESGQQVLRLDKTTDAENRMRDEAEAETMRLLYVAITRAAYRCYVGVGPFENSHRSAIARAVGVNEDYNWHGKLSLLMQETSQPHTYYLDAGVLPGSSAKPAEQTAPPALRVATFTADIKDTWRLYSFSALTRQQLSVKHTQRDEEFLEVGIESEQTADLALRFSLEKGARAGNLLHDMLEVTDFTAPDWGSCRDMKARLTLDDDEYDALTQWLDEVLETTLEPGLQLSSLEKQKTLREAEFYFPVERANWWQLKRLLTAHRNEISGEAALPVPNIARPQLEGMMHGFIDLIFEHQGKYYVADYKSTHLGNSCKHYHASALTTNNQQHLYDLQYLLYALALHRYLRVSLPGYEPDRHFGGVYYLYLRGMAPENENGEGVSFAPVRVDELLALDEIFRGEKSEMQK